MNTLLGAITDAAPMGPMTSATTGGGVVADVIFEGGGDTMPINLGPAPVKSFGPPFGGGTISQEGPSGDIFVKPEVGTAEKTDTGETGHQKIFLNKDEPKKMNMLLIGGGLLLAYFLLFRKKK